LGFLDRALQLIGAGHRVAVRGQHHVARLNAGVGRRARGALDHEPALHARLTPLVRSQRPYRQPQLAALAGVRATAGGVARLVVAPDLEVHARAGADARDLHRQLGRILERLAVELEDHVTGLDTGLLGRAALLDARYQRALRLRQAEGVGQPLGDVLDHDAELAARHVAAGLQLLPDLHGDVDRYRERHAHVAAAAAVDLRVDADHLALHVEQRAAGVARVDRHVGLDERHVVARQGAPLGADDARGGAVLEAERRADRQHPLPDPETLGVADAHRRQVLGAD